jgi:hypothetical protein
MLGQIITGIALICLTTLIHAAFMVSAFKMVERNRFRHEKPRHELAKAVAVSALTAWMCLGVVCEVLLWAAYYRWQPELGELPDLETAFYFSMVTFTSVGYGDVVLAGPPRVLASLQAANGVIIFGWTTAIIFFYVQQVYRRG